MKKFLSFMLMVMALVLPVAVNADSIKPVCGNKDANGVRTCTVAYNITEAKESLTITLTEQGGAQITSIDNTAGSDWTISSTPVENNNVWNVLLVSPGSSGEGDLFTFKYQESGTADCKVIISLGDNKVEVTPETTPDTNTNTTPDDTTENKDTGATLPYIALGAVVLVATGAYIATKNKSKMYKI